MTERLTQRTKELKWTKRENEYTAVIKVLTVKDQTLKNIHERLVAFSKNSSPLYAIVKLWARVGGVCQNYL